MAMTEYKTRTGTETCAEGELKAIFFNELKTKKDYGKNGKTWIPTHSVNIIIDEDKISLGLTDKEVLRVKDTSGNYHDLMRGQKISVVVSPNGEYKGVKQWQGRVSDVILIEQAPEGQSTGQGGQQKTYSTQKRDNSGIATGHAINVAMNVLGDISDPDEVIRVAKEANDLTVRLKKEYGDANPDMSEYDVGASVGQAILSASHFVESVDDIEEFARTTLDKIVPAVSAYVKGVQQPEATKKPAPKTAKKAVKKAAVKTEQVDDTDYDEDITNVTWDLEDDIPF